MKKRKNAAKESDLQITVTDDELAKLPQHVFKSAVMHGEDHARFVLGLNPTDKKYLPAVEAEAEKYLREGIHESLTPHMEDGINPTSPIAEDVFSLSPVFSLDGTFFKKIGNADERRERQRRFRAAANTIAGIYAVTGLSLNKKDYGIPKGASSEQKRNVELNKFKRVFLVDAVCTLLEELFRINPGSMDEFLTAGLKDKNLNEAGLRATFIKKVREQIREGMGKETFKPENLKKIF